MLLKISFVTRYEEPVLENFLLTISRENIINSKIFRNENLVDFYIDADEESLTKNIELISKTIPTSVFFDSKGVEVVDSFPNENEVIDASCDVDFPYCPHCLSKTLDKNQKEYFHNPIISCLYCGRKSINREISFSCLGTNLTSVKNTFEEIYINVAQTIIDGKNVSCEFDGEIFNIGLFPNHKNHFSKDIEILLCDLSKLSTITNPSDEEIKALASIEKPVISFVLSDDFKEKNSITQQMCKIKLADNLSLLFITDILIKKGIHYLYITSEKTDCDIKFIDNKILKKSLFEIIAPNNGDVVIAAKLPLVKKCIENKEDDFLESLNIKNKKVICFNFSQIFQDSVYVWHKNNYEKVVEISFPNTLKEIIEEIYTGDEIGQKLILNYKNSFPTLFANCLNVQTTSTNNLYSLMGILSILLGIYGKNDINCAARELFVLASSFKGKKGPKVDFKLKADDGSELLSYQWIFRSCMSYKLAGIDSKTLSYGILESFVEFLDRSVENIKKEQIIDAVAISGSFFDSKVLIENINKKIGSNTKILYSQKIALKSDLFLASCKNGDS